MNRIKSITITGLTSMAVVGALALTGTAQAKPPRNEVQVAQERAALMKAVAKGDDLWHNSSLGTNGLACGNCHPDGSATNPHTFPKYQSNLGKVGTLREMVNWCIAVPMQGKPLGLDSDDLIAMEAYATYTHRGVAIDPARDEQHGAVPVSSGPGYPSH